MLIPVANPITRNQIMSSAEIAEDILIQFQIPLILANHESKFVLKMKWVINQIRIKSLCQLLFLIVIQFFPTRIELSNNIRMRSKFCFTLFFHSKRKDERCNIQSLQHFLGNLHSFLYSLDEIRLADIKFKRFQQAFQFIKLPENVHPLKISCE